MKPEETVDFQIKYTWQLISRMYNEVAQKYNTTWPAGSVLLNIDPEGTPSTSLGPKMGMEATSLSRLLKSLEEKGVVERTTHPSDKRIVLVKLTEQGLVKREEASKAVKEFNKQVKEWVPKDKLDVFFEVIKSISEQITQGNISLNK